TAHGKMPAGTRLNGMPIVYAAADVSHGANPELIKQMRDGLINRLIVCIPDDYQFAEYLNAHYFSIEASPVNPGLFIGEYSFFQEPGDPDMIDQRDLRNHYAPCTVRFELPKDQAKKLWEELGRNPDFINLLYMQAFDGIEDPDKGAFGYRRVKSQTLYMAQGRDVARIPFPERPPREKIPQIIGSLHEVKYKRGAYGIGTPKSSTASQP
ncbi:hypothetical protein KBC79_00435, partial [Candidatus Woesebacteria bacterium]|nr:hypothetical protein [Candidatus Woesebacteria bacterium]